MKSDQQIQQQINAMLEGKENTEDPKMVYIVDKMRECRGEMQALDPQIKKMRETLESAATKRLACLAMFNNLAEDLFKSLKDADVENPENGEVGTEQKDDNGEEK